MLYEKIMEYAAGNAYPMHMPGHKRNTALLPPGLPYNLDISEIHGFDDLYNAHGALRETSELAAALYGSDRALLLVNGSTVGILAAIGAHAKRGEKVLFPGNCHRSVYNAVSLFGLDPVIITPRIDETSGVAGSVDPAIIEAALDKDHDIKLVLVTSPTYEGVISDIGTIADIVHNHGIPLIVDQAHGAHLGFSGGFPESAVRSGADVVVMSLHKTLPALTQCSLLHTCGGYSDRDGAARLLSILQTSSPSYVLMSSIDSCLRLLLSDKDKLFSEYEKELDQFDALIEPLRNLAVLCHGSDAPHPGFFDFDPGKLVITTKKTAISGIMMADILREKYGIEPELACPDYVIAMTSICDRPEGYARLANALLAIDKTLERNSGAEN